MLDRIEFATRVHARLVERAERAARDPYNTADGWYWLRHAERLSARIDAMLSVVEG